MLRLLVRLLLGPRPSDVPEGWFDLRDSPVRYSLHDYGQDT